MWNPPSFKELAEIPQLYETEQTPVREKIVHEHFFIGGCDWYAIEYDPKSRVFFGFAILNNDYEMAEFGYFSLDELLGIKQDFVEVDRDLYWEKRKVSQIGRIMLCITNIEEE